MDVNVVAGAAGVVGNADGEGYVNRWRRGESGSRKKWFRNNEGAYS